ncbi:hypothetical protein [Endozoicomonas sp. ONNA2]|uniref:hypothetical protein n=1 Tax=Endozoicomonas sp. ONNA2 TaxID=2828741 RepID=UPI002147F39A|nr:hypothetical protein [Endozoicomonas sp. ONNA2]
MFGIMVIAPGGITSVQLLQYREAEIATNSRDCEKLRIKTPDPKQSSRAIGRRRMFEQNRNGCNIAIARTGCSGRS